MLIIIIYLFLLKCVNLFDTIFMGVYLLERGGCHGYSRILVASGRSVSPKTGGISSGYSKSSSTLKIDYATIIICELSPWEKIFNLPRG